MIKELERIIIFGAALITGITLAMIVAQWLGPEFACGAPPGFHCPWGP